MQLVLTILAFLFVIALLVFIHEAGHFFVARWRRVWVHQFAIGFGPAIWKRQRGETEYSIRLFPLGGFVRMAGEDRLSEEDKAVPQDRLFTSKKPLERMAIVAAGPIANILAAILLQILIVAGFGVSYQEVAGFVEQSPAQEKLEVGDKFVEIEGQFIYSAPQIQRIIRGSQGQSLHVKVLRGGLAQNSQILEFDITPVWNVESNAYRIGTQFAIAGTTNKIQSLDASSLFAQSGLQAGDLILEINGVRIHSASQLSQQLELTVTAGQTAQMQVLRDGKTLDLTLDLKGWEFPQLLEGYRPELAFRSVGLAHSVAIGLGQIGDVLAQMYEVIKSLFAGKTSPGQALSGPVGIAGIIGQSLNFGWMPFLMIVALLSLNLGLINLFPFPALDGSRIVFILIELISRRPIPPDKEGMVHYIGFIILIALILLITYNDIRRLFGS
jgi:regulator of sigma E protease